MCAKKISKQKQCPFYALASEVTQHHFCPILLVGGRDHDPIQVQGRENKIHFLMAKEAGCEGACHNGNNAVEIFQKHTLTQPLLF